MSFLAEEERDDLPLVNALRDDVRRWRDVGLGERERNDEEAAAALVARGSRAAAVLLPARGSGDDHLPAGDSGARKEAALDAEADAGRFQRAEPRAQPAPEEWVAKVAQHPKLADIPNEAGLEADPSLRLQDGNGQRQDGRHGDAHFLGVLQSRARSRATRGFRGARWWSART